MTDHSLTPEAETLVCTELQEAFPNALSIYAFGSRVQGTANAQSDLDLAVWSQVMQIHCSYLKWPTNWPINSVTR